MLPFLRLCAAVLAAGAVLAAPAAALAPAPSPVAPADGATAQAGAPLAFTARGQGRWWSASRAHPRGRRVRALGEDGGRFDGTPSPADPTLVQFTAPRAWPRASGSGRWATRRTAPSARCATSRSSGPARPPAHARRPQARPTPAGALPKLARAPIPLRIGTSNHALLVLALSESSPSVSRSRLIAVVRNSAQRWRLDARGPVKRVPRLGDGHDDVGFAGALVSEGALGTTTLLRQNYVRVRRVCAAAGCHTTRTPAGSRIVERDLALLPDVPGRRGPRTRSATSTTSRP
jgi:hypothetical protein